MKKILLVFLIAATLDAADIQPISGQLYRSWPEDMRTLFAAGFYMGFGKGHAHGRAVQINETRQALSDQGVKPLSEPIKMTTPIGDNLESCLSSFTVGQAVGILDKYVADHPERWDKQVMDLAEQAFLDACEKRAKRP
jgi:hypothetical protein